jgi:acyl carrier protein
MLKDIVKRYLVETKGKDAALFEKADLSVAELGLDSLDMVEMLFEIEDLCGFQLADPMRYLNMSYAEMLADIESEIREHNNGELPDFDPEART